MVNVEDKIGNILVEASLSRIWQHIEKGNSLGVITAFRSNDPDNLKKNKKLQSEINVAGFGYFPMNGVYIEDFGSDEPKKVEESSFFVISTHPEKLRDFLIKMGKKYEQDSVLFMDNSVEDKVAVLIGTKADAWPGLGVVHTLGKWHPNKIRDFYSKLKGSKSFVFEDIDINMDLPTGLMARSVKNKIDEKGLQ